MRKLFIQTIEHAAQMMASSNRLFFKQASASLKIRQAKTARMKQSIMLMRAAHQ